MSTPVDAGIVVVAVDGDVVVLLLADGWPPQAEAKTTRTAKATNTVPRRQVTSHASYTPF